MASDPAIIAGPPVLSRDPENLPADLPRGGDVPDDLDPLADGILMQHQIDWLADKSTLKVAEKGRRTGITFAEALDDTILAATARSAGGDNVFYIGDTKDKGREFIGYVAHFAKIIAGGLHPIEEFIFRDERPDGTSRDISAFRIQFASGYRVEALSSNPANIRGLQGTVVIDEAAYHRDVREVIDAVNALLIWGGKVRVISTHKGALNAFNELIREAHAGKNGFKVHHIPFSDAVKNGLFKRVCAMKGQTWTPEAEAEWEAMIRKSYGARTAAMRQELDAVPAEAEGAALTRVQIENCMEPDIPVCRWACDDDFRNLPEDRRKAAAREWCDRELGPVLDKLNPARRHYAGEEFARSGDVTDILIASEEPDLTRRTQLVVELRNVPFDQQRDILFYVFDRVPRLTRAALDKTGNGAYLAEKAVQRYGSIAIEVSFSREWYLREMPAYIEAFSDCTIVRRVSRAEARRLGYDPEKPAPDDGTYRWKNKRTGEVLRVPNGIDPGWQGNPGIARERNVQRLLSGKLDGMSDAGRSAAVKDIAKSRLMRAIQDNAFGFDKNDPAKLAIGRIAAPIAALPDDVAGLMGTDLRVVNFSVANAAKQLGKPERMAFTPDTYLIVQRMLDAGEVFSDGSRSGSFNLAAYIDGVRWTAALKRTSDGKFVFLKNLRRAKERDLKGDRWSKLR